MKVNLGLTTFWKIPLEGLLEKHLRNLLADYSRKQRKRFKVFASHGHMSSIFLTFPKEAIYMNDPILLILVGPAR